jgi:diguanylate cyclase (GGDEF)-like protein
MSTQREATTATSASGAQLLSAMDIAPFRGHGLRQRLGAFALVAVVAEASLALPGGHISGRDTVISVTLLAIAGLAIVALPWDNLPQWSTVVVPVAYTASVLMLILAFGRDISGVGIVILIPLVWTALYHRRWESAVVVVAIVAVEIVISLTPIREPWAVVIRRAGFWGTLGLAISFAVHGLRERLQRAFGESERLYAMQTENLRRMVALESASEELTTTLDPQEVMDTATRLLAELVSPAGSDIRRAQYLRAVDGIVHIPAQYDEGGHKLNAGYSLSEHPRLEQAVRSGETSHGPLDLTALGPAVRAMVEERSITHSVHVPVKVDGRVDGVLVTSMRGEVPVNVVEQCKAMGHLTELALANALSHNRERELATTDALTGLANRRSFEQLITQRPGRGVFSVVVIDVDGLKEVNDSKGHLAGDALLRAVAAALSSVMRRGDVLARIGGDEFALLCFEADLPAAEDVARRMLEALGRTMVGGSAARASMGIASGVADDDTFEVFHAADTAMYQAKREGGERYAVAESARR